MIARPTSSRSQELNGPPQQKKNMGLASRAFWIMKLRTPNTRSARTGRNNSFAKKQLLVYSDPKMQAVVTAQRNSSFAKNAIPYAAHPKRHLHASPGCRCGKLFVYIRVQHNSGLEMFKFCPVWTHNSLCAQHSSGLEMFKF